MDFNDDRSIFINSQMTLDINLAQNDYLANYETSHIPYFMNDVNETNLSPILNVCESSEPHTPQNVLCSDQQLSDSSKVQNSNHSVHQHSTQQASIQSSNRSRNLNQDHIFQPLQFNSFLNQSVPASKQFTSNIVQIDQQMNYIDIQNQDESMVFTSEVVNPNNNIIDNSVYDKKDTLYHNNPILKNTLFNRNELNHHQSHSENQRLQSEEVNLNFLQQQNNDSMIESERNNVVYKNSHSTNLSTNNFKMTIVSKNKTNPLLSQVHNQEYYHSSLPNYYNSQKSIQHNDLFAHQEKQVNNTSTNYFNDTSSIDLITSSLEQSTQNSLIVDSKSQAIKLKNNNLPLNNCTNSSPSLILQNKTNQSVSDINNNLTVEKMKQKAETKTIFIIKIVDQVVFNGKVVKETILKDDFFIKNTGYIDWPETMNNCNINSSLPTKLTNNNQTKNANKPTLKSKNFKSNIFQKGHTRDKKKKEKKIKTKNCKFELSKVDVSKNKLFRKTNIKDKIIQPTHDKLKLTKKESTTLVSKEQSKLINKDIQIASHPHLIKDEAYKTEDKGDSELTLNKNNVSLNLNSNNSTKKSLSDENYVVEEAIFRPKIDVNQKVLSRWIDRNFYPGTVLIQEKDRRWRICFDDGGRRLVREDAIISIEFIPRGQKVMVNYSNGFVAKGIIKSYRLDPTNSQIYYLIEYTLGSKLIESEYNAKDVFLTGENAISLLNQKIPNINNSKFADVDLNNIIPAHRRSHAQKLNQKTNDISNSLNGFTNELEIVENYSNNNLSIPANNSTTIKKSLKKAKSSVSNITSDEKSESTFQPNTSTQPESSNVNIDFQLNTVENLNINYEVLKNNKLFVYDGLIGPIPKNDLFKKFAFFLSFDDEKRNLDSNYNMPFDIKHLTKQIKSGCGLILDKFEDIKDNYQVVLVSHSYHQSVKYMMCLSSGIPCIKFTWVIDSCKKNELLKKEDYILPSGFSILTNNLLEDRTIHKKSSTLFKGIKIYLIFSSANSELNKWLPLFNSLKAIIHNYLPETASKSNTADLVVSDKNCSKEIVERANNLKIPIVSLNYIIECLIHGKRLDTDHSIFHYSYSSSSRN